MAAGLLCEPERSDPGFINLLVEEVRLHDFPHQLTHSPASSCVGKNEEWGSWLPGGSQPEEELLGQKDQRHQATAHIAPGNSPELCYNV